MDMDMEWIIDDNETRNSKAAIKAIFADLYKAFDNAQTNDVEYILETHGKCLLENEHGYHGNGVVHLAAMFEYDCFNWVVRSGGDINQRSSFSGYTPLMIGAVNNSKEMVNTLLNHNVDLETVDKEGHTALHLAIIYNNMDIAKLLILKQNDLNVQSRLGLTPLHLATIHSQPITAKLLIDNGAYVNVFDNKTKTPLHHACERGWLRNAVVLMENGALHDVFDSSDHTPLIYAIECCHEDIVEFLMNSSNSGVNVNLRGVLGKQPIHYAAESANRSILATLIAAGSDINSLDENDYTPLATAVANNKPENVRLLLHNNADFNTSVSLSGSRDIKMSIIIVAIQINAVAIVMSLLYEGYKCTTDDILQLVNFTEKISNPEYKRHILDMIKNPTCLKRLCRRIIRDKFTTKTLDRLDNLPLPTAILEYISHVP